MDNKGINFVRFLTPYFLFMVLLIQCTFHQVKLETKLQSKGVAKNVILEVLSEPSQEDPVVVFRAFKKIPQGRTIDSVQYTSRLDREGHRYFKKIRQGRATDSVPCEVNIWLGETELVSRIHGKGECGRIDLYRHVGLIPEGQDLEFTIMISDNPQIFRKLVIPKKLISYWKEQRAQEEVRARQDEIKSKKERVERERLKRERQLAEEREKRRREEAENAMRSKDVIISLGMSEEKVKFLVGEPTRINDCMYYESAYRQYIYEYLDGTQLWFLFKYSHYTGSYDLVGVMGYDKTLPDYWGGTWLGWWLPAEKEGTYPMTETGIFKRVNRKWWYEYYYEGKKYWKRF